MNSRLHQPTQAYQQDQPFCFGISEGHALITLNMQFIPDPLLTRCVFAKYLACKFTNDG